MWNVLWLWVKSKTVILKITINFPNTFDSIKIDHFTRLCLKTHLPFSRPTYEWFSVSYLNTDVLHIFSDMHQSAPSSNNEWLFCSFCEKLNWQKNMYKTNVICSTEEQHNFEIIWGRHNCSFLTKTIPFFV